MSTNNLWRVAYGAIAIVVAMAVAASTVFAADRQPRATDFAASVATAGHAAAVPVSGKVLGGFTSQGWPVAASISKDGRRIVVVRIGLDMTCTSGASFGLRDGWNAVRIARNGHVSVAGTATQSSGGVTFTFSSSVTGRLNHARTTFSGTWHLHVAVQPSSGPAVECDSGKVSFNAIL